MHNVAILILAILLNSFYSANAQCDNLDSTFNASFANTSDTIGWAIIDNNVDNNTWIVYKSFFDSTLKYSYSSVSNANDWAFSQCLSLLAVNQYSLSFDCKGGNGIEKLMVLITSAQDTGSVIDTLYNMDSIYWTSPQIFDTTFQVSSSGNYHIAFWVYSDKNQSSLDIDDVKFEKLVPTSLTDVALDHFNFYPNPTNEILNIKLENQDPSRINIFDFQGKMIKSVLTNSISNTIDISDLKQGIYFINVVTDKFNRTKRLMIL